MATNINEIHNSKFSWKQRFAVWVTDHIGTVECAIVFSGIGMASIVGIVTGNNLLGIGLGAFSSYFLQLVLLPLIMVKQNIDQTHAELVAENDYLTDKRTEWEIEEIHKKLDELLKR